MNEVEVNFTPVDDMQSQPRYGPPPRAELASPDVNLPHRLSCAIQDAWEVPCISIRAIWILQINRRLNA